MGDKFKFTFLIPSFNRYDKLINLVNQINEYQNADILIYNDASNDDRYQNLPIIFNNITLINNKINNGKLNYNKTLIELFNTGIQKNSDYYVLLADDFILCKDFIKNLSPFLNLNNIVNIFSIRDKCWGKSGWVDGALVSSTEGIKVITSMVPKNLKAIEGKSTGVWESVTLKFSNQNVGEFKLVNLNYSLTQHDGNDDSKLHPNHRLKFPIVANNFYDYFYGSEIKIIGESQYISGIKKKGSIDIRNGNKIKNNGPDKPYIPPVPTEPTINSSIEFNKDKLNSIKDGLKTPKQSRINKIGVDVFLAKSRKRNLRLGGR